MYLLLLHRDYLTKVSALCRYPVCVTAGCFHPRPAEAMGGSSYRNPETQLSGHGHLTGAGTYEVTLLGNKTLNLTLLPLHLSPAPCPKLWLNSSRNQRAEQPGDVVLGTEHDGEGRVRIRRANRRHPHSW